MKPKYVHISAIVVFSQFDTPFCTAYLLNSKAINSAIAASRLMCIYKNLTEDRLLENILKYPAE